MKNKEQEVHELLKLPPEAIIYGLRIELGKKNAYISELEDKLKYEPKPKPGHIETLENTIKNLKDRLISREVAQDYAAFCVRADREDLPLLDFDSWLEL